MGSRTALPVGRWWKDGDPHDVVLHRPPSHCSFFTSRPQNFKQDRTAAWVAQHSQAIDVSVEFSAEHFLHTEHETAVIRSELNIVQYKSCCLAHCGTTSAVESLSLLAHIRLRECPWFCVRSARLRSRLRCHLPLLCHSGVYSSRSGRCVRRSLVVDQRRCGLRQRRLLCF